jgi:hypothetical protein
VSGSEDGMISIESIILCGESKPCAGNPGAGSLISFVGYSFFRSCELRKSYQILFAIFEN